MYTFILFSFILGIVNCEIKTATNDIKKNEYVYYKGVGWVRFHPIPTTWAEARLRCLYGGAELMSPVNDQMQKVMSEIAGTAPMWTGVHDTYSKGDYFSINGVPLSAMPVSWAQDEPNNENNNEDCMIMLSGGKMADCGCNETFSFSCHKPNNFKTANCGIAPGYELDQRTGNCYKFHVKPQSWINAFMICAAEGAHLAVIDSPGEQQVLRDLFNRYPPSVIQHADHTTHIHLGFTDWKDQKLWMTINGKSIDDLIQDKITAWASGEPNYIHDHFGSMTRDGTLNDIPSHLIMAFICEYETKDT